MKRWSILLTSLLSLQAIAANEPAPESRPDPRAGVFSAEFPYISRYTTVNGHRIHYIDEGKGQVFLFLHGNPTSMYLWRNVMPWVVPKGRIVAMDNIGFGQSDQPEDLDYTFDTHYQYVSGFIQDRGLKDIILVIHDWGSVLGLKYAMDHEDNVRGIVMMEAIIPPAFPMAKLEDFGPLADLFRQFRNEETGRKLLIDDNMFIEGILLNGPLTRQLSEAEKAAYRKPFLNKDKRFPIYVWPNELPIGGVPARNVKTITAIGKWLESSPVPKLLQYVSPGAIVSPASAAWMAEHYRNIETEFTGYGAHYIQEDNPQVIGRGIAEWYRRTFQKQ